MDKCDFALPYQQFWQRDPLYVNLRIIGSRAHSLIPTQQHISKMDSVSEKGMLVGYSSHSKAYRVLVQNDDNTFAVIERRDVICDESVVGFAACFNKPKSADIFDPMDVDDQPSTSTTPPGATPPERISRSGRVIKPSGLLKDTEFTPTLMQLVMKFYALLQSQTIQALSLWSPSSMSKLSSQTSN
jgi:hypothetical protein